MKRPDIKAIRKNAEAFKFYYTDPIHKRNQACSYEETHGPTVDILLDYIEELEKRADEVAVFYVQRKEWIDFKAHNWYGNELEHVHAPWEKAREFLKWRKD